MIVDNVGADQKRKSSPVVSQRRLGAELGGLAVDPPTSNSGDVGQLVQAMAASAPAAQVTA
jgi:hypothetical protein